VSLIQYNDGIPTEEGIAHRLPKEHTVRQKLENSPVGIGHILETDSITNLGTELAVHLIGHTGGDRCSSDTARLRTGHGGVALIGITGLDQELWDLGGLTC
jgi:hypothetical protein